MNCLPLEFDAAYGTPIGAIGHRTINQPELIIPAVDEVLEVVERVFNCSRLTVLSSLAEGADRLIVQRCLMRPASRLVAVLPMPPDSFTQDFESVASKEEFRRLLNAAHDVLVLTSGADQIEAYQKAAQCLVDSSAAMLAIWDGLPARGPGGTAETVALARDRKIPLAWIRAATISDRGAPADPGQRTAGGVVFENWPEDPGRQTTKE